MNDVFDKVKSQCWTIIPPEQDIFWEMAERHGFVDVDVELIPTVDKMEALKNKTIYGFLVSNKKLDLPYLEDNKAEYITLIPQQCVDMSPTSALLSVLLNADVEIIGNKQERFNYLRDHSLKDLCTFLLNDTEFKSIQNSYESIRPPSEYGYHYIGFIFKYGWIWELDGRNESARGVMPSDEFNCLDDMKELFTKQKYFDRSNNRVLAITCDYRITIGSSVQRNDDQIDEIFRIAEDEGLDTLNKISYGTRFQRGRELVSDRLYYSYTNSSLEYDRILLELYQLDRKENLKRFWPNRLTPPSFSARVDELALSDMLVSGNYQQSYTSVEPPVLCTLQICPTCGLSCSCLPNYRPFNVIPQMNQSYEDNAQIGFHNAEEYSNGSTSGLLFPMLIDQTVFPDPLVQEEPLSNLPNEDQPNRNGVNQILQSIQNAPAEFSFSSPQVVRKPLGRPRKTATNGNAQEEEERARAGSQRYFFRHPRRTNN